MKGEKYFLSDNLPIFVSLEKTKLVDFVIFMLSLSFAQISGIFLIFHLNLDGFSRNGLGLNLCA